MNESKYATKGIPKQANLREGSTMGATFFE